MSFWEALLNVPYGIWLFVSSPIFVFLLLVLVFIVCLAGTFSTWTDWYDGYYSIYVPILWTTGLITVVWVFVALIMFFTTNQIMPNSWEPTNR